MKDFTKCKPNITNMIARNITAIGSAMSHVVIEVAQPVNAVKIDVAAVIIALI